MRVRRTVPGAPIPAIANTESQANILEHPPADPTLGK